MILGLGSNGRGVLVANTDYSPVTGRFLTEDPAKAGLNYYTYCNNNPIIFVDPLGLDAALQTLGTGVFGGIGGKYYGGDQTWFSEKWLRKTGCGTAAASNILAYYAQKDPVQYGALYASADLTRNSYVEHMYQTLNCIQPINANIFTIYDASTLKTLVDGTVSFGYWGVDNFVNDISKYASDQGVNLTGSWMTKNYGYDYYMGDLLTREVSDAVSFIESGLNLDSPVAMLIYGNKAGKNMISNRIFQNHWVTITSIALNSNNEYDIIVSSWGEEHTLNLNKLWNSNGEIGLAYFQ